MASATIKDPQQLPAVLTMKHVQDVLGTTEGVRTRASSGVPGGEIWQDAACAARGVFTLVGEASG